MRIFLLTLLAMLVHPAIHALEGGSTSARPEWQGIKPVVVPDATVRAKELADRQAAIAADIGRLTKRLSTTPSTAKMTALKAKLQEVYKNYGWEPVSQLVYGRRSITPMLKEQSTVPKNLLAAFIQLDRDLKARGIDLIILPLVPTPHFHAHTLVDGIGPDQDYYPGWTKMTIEMLRNDLEVIDTVDEFRREASNDVLVSWVNDFHTGSTGRQLAARALAKRLQRYDFARDLQANRSRWTTTVQQKKGAMFPQRITTVNGAFTEWPKNRLQELPPGTKTWPRRHPGRVAIMRKDAPDFETALKQRTFGLMTIKGPNDAALRRTELVLIGDSQLHSAVYGAGLPAFIMAEVGGLFRWGSKSWSGFSPPEIYREVVPDRAVKPRVVVLTFLPKYFWHKYKRDQIDEKANRYRPRPLPPVSGTSTATLPKTLSVNVQLRKISKKPTDDASSLDYDEALMHVAAVIQDGQWKGREIGIRYWILHKGAWTKADGRTKAGQSMQLELTAWDQAVSKDGSLAQHMIFNDTGQGLQVPVYWVSGGGLAPNQIVK